MSNLLDDLFFKYHADKTPRIKHHYSDVYFELFEPIKHEVTNILEIGIAEGASLFAWRDYFPNALIHGADIDRNRIEKLEDEERMNIFYMDQSNVDDLIDMQQNMDIVIDDGSHNPADQVFTCLALMPQLVKYCIYIIEDVDDATAPAIKQILETKYNVEERHVGSRHDDRLLIVRHRE